MVGDEECYDGLPTRELAITDVDVPAPTHLRRSLRYPGAVDIAPIAAIEAALDTQGLIARDPRSRTGEAVRVVGYSPTADRVLVVVLLPHDHPPRGLWHVATAWPANSKERHQYADSEEQQP